MTIFVYTVIVREKSVVVPTAFTRNKSLIVATVIPKFHLISLSSAICVPSTYNFSLQSFAPTVHH